MHETFRSYEEFFLFYLRQHSSRANRLLHGVGTTLGFAVAIVALLLHHPWFALLWPAIGYGFAWIGHLVIERNRPATWRHPWWSFRSDFRMIGLMITGKLDAWIASAEATEHRQQRTAAAD